MTNFIYNQAENILSKLKDCPADQMRMEYTLLNLKAILLDAEEKQEHNQNLHTWLKELQNVFYQIEDSIDEFKWEQASLKHDEIGGKQVNAHFLCSDRISAHKCKSTRKIKKICDRLDAIATKMYEFNLTETCTHSMETTHSFLRTTEVSTRLIKPSWQLNYPLTDAPEKYENARHQAFLDYFIESTNQIFHIVGDAGIGKSTLAKFIYNDKRVIEKFTSRYWICAKEGFNTGRLMKEIYSFADDKESCDDFNMMSLKIRRFLREKTNLFVFQDLSITNLEDNRCMLDNLLARGESSSKIIVTTQSNAIATISGNGIETINLTENQDLAIATQSGNGIETINLAENQDLAIATQSGNGIGTINLTENQDLAPGSNQNSNNKTGDSRPEINNLERLSPENSPRSNQNSNNKPGDSRPVIYNLERLSPENSVLLFKDYAFRDIEKVQNQEFTAIGNTIVEKCKGVPLAIKCMGSMLSSKTITEWENFEKKLREIQREENDSILAILRLCYNQMSSYLKSCFLHCSQLTNDRIFSSNDVIQLWMAHGLLYAPEENNLSVENIGEKYFMELWSRCFVQEIEEHGVGYWFKLHPLIQKLADIITQEQAKEGPVGPKSVTEIRSMAFPVSNKVLPSASLIEKCISRFKCLRMLNLSNANLQEIPNVIGTLKSLRYLDLSGNKKIKRLPDSICNLHSLQTLLLASCSALEELPKNIRKLISLRYLWITTNKLHLHKNGVGTMTSLRFLAIGGCEKLQNLFHRPECLVGLETLMIYGCKTLKSLPNEMGFLKSLQNLMIWNCKKLTLTLKEVEFRLQRFTIRELPKVDELPEWLEGSTETLRILQIISCPIRPATLSSDLFGAVERATIYGAVRIENSAPGDGFQYWNMAFCNPAAVSKTKKYY